MKLLRDPDAQLVAACRDPSADGFGDAFEVLFQRYRERAYAIAYRISGNQADALDIVQESFALVFRKLGSFKGNSLFSTWLFRIVANCSIDHRRRRKAGVAPILLADEDPRSEVADAAAGPREAASVQEVGEQVQEAIASLSPKLRAILALRYLEHMSYDELAATLEISIGTVKSRLARAHIALEHVIRTRYPHLDVSGAQPADGPDGSDGDEGGDRDPVGGVG